MKMGAWPAMAPEIVRFAGQAVAVVIAETKNQAKDAAEAVVVDYEELAGCGRYPRRDQAGRAAAASGSGRQHDLRLDHRRRGGDRGGVQIGGQCGLARHHQQPAGAECDGAARGDRRIQRRRGAFHALHDVAEPACRASRAVGVLQHRAGAQAAGGGAGCRRRFRLQDLHLSRRDGGAVGLQEGAPPGEVDRRSLRGLPHRRPWPRPPDQGRDGVRQGQQDHRAAGEDLRQSRRLYVAVLLLGADLSLCDAAVGPVQHPQHLRRGDQRLYQHHPGRRLSRRRPARSQFRGGTPDGNGGAAVEGRSGRIAPQEFHHHASRTRRRSSWPTTSAISAPRWIPR